MSRIALIGENSTEYINILLDIWNNGDSAVLIDWRIPPKAAIELISEVGVKKCFVEKELVDYSNVVCSSQVTLCEYERNNEQISELPNSLYAKYRARYAKSEAVVLFSSGTTGSKKGIILSHYAISTNADSILDYMHLHDDDSIFITKGLAHVSTLVGELLVGLKSQTKIFIAPSLVSPQLALKIIEQNNITIVCTNPTLLSVYTKCQAVKQFHLTNLKGIYISGSVADQNLLIEAGKLFAPANIFNVYGLTEAGPRVAAQTIDNKVFGSVGKAIKGVAIKIMDERNQEVEVGKVGSIFVKTPSLFSGYVSRQNEHTCINSEWLDTKDLGYVDKENNLFVIGRRDNMIHVGSHNVYPEHVESIIRSMEMIDDCAVVGEANRIYGSVLVCYYVSQGISDKTIKAYCATYLAPYEVPQKFVLLDVLPRTPNGKVDYLALKKLGSVTI